MKFRIKFLLLFLLTSFTACELDELIPTSPEETVEEKAAAGNMTQMLNLVNQLRREGCKCGSTYMPPVEKVSWNYDLEDSALRHAADMKNNDFFDHRGSDGSDVGQRVSEAGYSWQTVGENIAWGYRDIATVFQGWRDSPGHCRNLMNGKFRHMGVARVGNYWVQDFARPRGN